MMPHFVALDRPPLTKTGPVDFLITPAYFIRGHISHQLQMSSVARFDFGRISAKSRL